MSILTYKLKHNKNLIEDLKKATHVANYSIKHKKCRTTKDVRYIGLKACISNQILKKYGSNKKIKKVSKVKLTINGYFVNINKEKKEISVPALKIKLNYQFPDNFIKINQVELDHEYIYISVEIQDKPEISVDKYLGVDRNTTGHCAVVAMPHNGKVIKLGKKSFHIHRKYKKIRARLQKLNAKKFLKKIRRREKNIIRDINHKVSNKIVKIALENNCGIKLEKLGGIRKRGDKKTKKNKTGESFKSSINTWEFYQLQSMIEYKSKICGIPVVFIDPHYTSQRCSRCKTIGTREQKKFTCSCGHVDHADSNAAFNIAAFELSKKINECNDQLLIDRDINKGSTDTPHLETQLCESKVA
jgi:putative transposase